MKLCQSLVIVILVVSLQTKAQLFNRQVSIDQESSSVDWRKISLVDFNIFYPKENNYAGQRLANILEKYRPEIQKNLSTGTVTEKIDIVLHSKSSVSNAFVALAPRRSEFNLAPILSEGVGPNEWLFALGIHEYRHVVQFDKLNQRFNKVLYFFLGEQGSALGSFITMPRWFFEGDAVDIETRLSLGGRGRISSFSEKFKSLVVAKDGIDYETLINKSYNYPYPDHYVYGYFFVSYLKQNFGEDIFSKIIDEATCCSYNVFTFYNAVEKITKKEYKVLFSDFLKDLKFKWETSKKNITESDFNLYKPSSGKDYLSYDNLFFFNQKLHAIRYSLDKHPMLVKFDNNKEEELIEISLREGDYLTNNEEKVLFTQKVAHLRWGQQSYSDIYQYNLKTKKLKRMTKKGYFKHPVVSNKGQLAAFSFKSGKNELCLIKSTSKFTCLDLKKSLISYLNWLNEETIVAIGMNEQGEKGILSIDIKTGEAQELLKFKSRHLNGLRLSNDKKGLYFESNDNINTQLFKFDLNNNSLQQMTKSFFDSTRIYEHGDEKRFYFLRGSRLGRKIGYVDAENWKGLVKKSDMKDPSLSYFKKLDHSKKTKKIDELTKYPSKKLKLTEKLVNFHSWTLLPIPLSTGINLSARTSNIFNTLQFGLGYSFNALDDEYKYSSYLQYSKYYPIFSLGLSRERNRRFDSDDRETRKTIAKWDENEAEVRTTFPFNFSRGLWQRKLLTSLGANFSELDGLFSEKLKYRGFFGEIQFFNIKKPDFRDVFPRLGQSFLLSYNQEQSIGSRDFHANQFSARANFFFPGFFNNDSLIIKGGYEDNGNGNGFNLDSKIPSARGYGNLKSSTQTFGSLGYYAPLFNPDFSLGKWYYLKRLSGGVFFDYTKYHFDRFGSFSRKSTGVEFLFENKFFRLLPLTIGVRASYLIEPAQVQYDVFLGTSIF